jgi:serine-type D-Ala-D-Ala endopeptidase (penicillin-binding protein 7)
VKSTIRAALRALTAAALAASLWALPVGASLAAGTQTAAAKSARAGSDARKVVRTKSQARSVKRTTGGPVVQAAPPQLSMGQLAGLHAADDALDLKSSVALVVDQNTDEVLFSKNSSAVLPIASITKLMTALVVTEAGLPLDEVLTVTREDAAVQAGSRRQLRAGDQLTRGEMLHLALMASENRAAYLLGRTYPGGMADFVEAMNAKAKLLGMQDTRYVEPTGLSSDNRSSAQDLALLVRAASQYPLLRELSTSPETVVPVGRRQVQFRNTNGLVRDPEWDIGLQKTGYIAAAGRCLVMQTQLAGRQLIMVLLDSAGKYSRIGDAERIRKWLSAQNLSAVLPTLGAMRVAQPR